MTVAEPQVQNAAAEELLGHGRFASVCLLSFERLNFVRDTISSLLSTADFPFELIVHDDGSRDPVLREYLCEMVEAGVISTLILNPPGWNQGQGIAVNRMFGAARGNPLVKLDQDMTFEPGWLAQCVDILDQNYHAAERPGSVEPRIGALGVFRYEADPVDHHKMHICDWVTFHQVKDFVGSVIVIPEDVWGEFGPWEERSVAFAEDNTFKLMMTRAPNYCCALTPEDLGTNHGFGVGPSTLVVAPDTVRDIKLTPKILTP